MTAKSPAASQPTRLAELIHSSCPPGLVLVVPLSLSERLAGLHGRVLSKAERNHASQFLVPEDRERHLLAWTCVRLVLASVLGVSPNKLRFAENGSGKKRLVGQSGGIEFNLSHGGAFVLCAFALGRQIGVDVEAVKAHSDLHGLAARFFTPREAARLASLTVTDRPEYFFTLWTRKEALLKAVGVGLGTPLNEVDVGGDEPSVAHEPTTRRLSHDRRLWSLFDIEIDHDHRAAVALEGSVLEKPRVERATAALFLDAAPP